MNLSTKVAYSVATNPWTLLVSTIGSVVGLGVLINDRFFVEAPTTKPIVLFISVTAIYIIVSGIALRALEKNRKLKEVAEIFREINAIYRDRLFSAFYGKDPISDKDELIKIEKATLIAVCQRVALIYSNLIGKQCVATVKLLTQEKDENNINTYVTTYARSENDSVRDKVKPARFAVNEGLNTAFDQALLPNNAGDISHFYSADLNKDKKFGNYNNERANWEKQYQSTIVVPIRCMGVEEKSERSDIGFLCIDTKSRNRLDNSHHLIMLAALSDQMYNFMSLMRGKYTVYPGTINK